MKRAVTIEDVKEANDTEKFGYRIGQIVEIIDDGYWFGWRAEITSFNKGSVEVTVHGPSGEPPDGATFFPDELQSLVPESIQ